MDEELKGEIQVGLGRHLIGREVGGLDQIVRQHGTPEIEIGEPRRPGDKQRPVRLTWVVDGERMSSVIPATTPSENPHNLVRDHQERLGRERGGTLVTETQRIGLNGRRTIERRVDHFPPPKSAHVADRALRPKPRARGAGRPKAQATRSSARSGDSGDDSSSDEPPPPRRVCLLPGCDEELPATRTKYCCDAHGDTNRQRRHRRLTATPKAVRFRQDVHLGITEDGFDRHRHDPYRDFDNGREEGLRLVELVVCRCNGDHLELEAGSCSKCGRWLHDLVPGGRDLFHRFHGRLERAEAERRERGRARLSGAVVA